MSQTAQLSLIVPTYHPKQQYFIDLLGSIKPHAKYIELIIINDAPDDKVVPQALKDYSKIFPNLIIHNNKQNQGIFYAYSKGFELASARYTGILDHDDKLNIAPLVKILEDKTTYELVYTNEYKFDDTQILDTTNKPSFDILSSCFYFYTHHVTLFNTKHAKQVFKTLPSYDIDSAFDIWFSVNYLRQINYNEDKIIQIPEASYGWRVHKNSTSANIGQKPYHVADRIKIAKEFFDSYEDNGIYRTNPQIPYLVEARFNNQRYINKTYKTAKESLQNISFGKNIKTSLSGDLSDKDYQKIWDNLKLAPIQFLLQKIKGSLIICADNKVNNKNHLNTVPILQLVDKKPKGLLIKTVNQTSKKLYKLCVNNNG